MNEQISHGLNGVMAEIGKHAPGRDLSQKTVPEARVIASEEIAAKNKLLSDNQHVLANIKDEWNAIHDKAAALAGDIALHNTRTVQFVENLKMAHMNMPGSVNMEKFHQDVDSLNAKILNATKSPDTLSARRLPAID